MFRQSSSRNSRTKGIRVKHVLQICLLLGVCFWLIYQVKHSHDKKKEFDEDDVIISSKVQTGNDVLKFGRKELKPHLEKLITLNEKHVEEEEEEEEAGGEDQLLHDDIDTKENERHEEETEEEDLEEEQSKHDEEEESKNGETEDGDEIDEHDQDKADQIEDFVDEEKVNDDKDGEVTESEEKEGNSTENGGHEEEGGRNTHEVREEQYKGDDASSAVVHDTQVITTESKNLSSVTSSENSEMKVSEIDGGKKNSSVTINGILNETAYQEEVNNSSSYKTGESFHLNSTMANELSKQLHVSNDSTQVSTERSNNSTGENVVTKELVFLHNGTESLSQITLYNGTDDLTTGEGTTLQTVDSEHANNITASGGDRFDSNSTLASKMEKFDGSAEFINSSNHSGFPLSENNLSSNTTVDARNSTSESSTNEDMDPTVNDKSDNNKESSETNEGSGSSSDENMGAVQHNSMDSSIVRDEENRTDLDVLPESKIEGDGNGDAAAE